MQLTYRGVIYATDDIQAAVNPDPPPTLTYRGHSYTPQSSVFHSASPSSSLQYRGVVYENH